jgi:hypothetical protein
MSIVLLRTLTKKSIIQGGKHQGLQVADVLLRSKISLIYSYFNYSGISFTSDVLDELHIAEEDRIAKPGKDVEKFKKYEERNHYLAAKSQALKSYDLKDINGGLVNVIKRKINKGKALAKYKGLIERERITYSKASLKAKNQNKW